MKMLMASTTATDKSNKVDCVCFIMLLVQITNIGTTEFCQGKTMRWGLAWTFDPSITFPVRFSLHSAVVVVVVVLVAVV